MPKLSSEIVLAWEDNSVGKAREDLSVNAQNLLPQAGCYRACMCNPSTVTGKWETEIAVTFREYGSGICS